MTTDITSKNFLTDLMLQFKDSMVAGADRILPDALWLLGALGTIELALALILNRDEDPLLIITHKFFKFAFFFWLVKNWTSGLNLTKQWFDMFQYFGIKMALGVGGNGEVSPSSIAEFGIRLTDSLSISILKFSTATGVAGNVALIFIKIIIMFVILACFLWMALQLFITCLEFYLTSTLTVVLLPFGVNKHTSFIGEKAIGAVISFSIKIMVVQFILCIAVPIAEPWTLEVTDKDLTPIFRAVFGCVGLAYITWKLPQYIQGVLSGSPSLHAGDAVGGAKSAIGGAVSVASGGVTGGMRIAGAAQAAMNSPGGRNNNGSVNWGGAASNMGTIMRASMPDQAAQMEGRALFSRGTSLAKESSQRQQAQSQTNLDL